MLVSELDFAKYPFTREASDYIRTLDPDIKELDSPEYADVVDRAEQRIIQAISEGFVSPSNLASATEILSFPVAKLLTVYVSDGYLRRRYALAESQRAGFFLREEDETKLLEIARTSLQWQVEWRPFKSGATRVLAMHFADYLRNAAGFHDFNWKLVNRSMSSGWVKVDRIELVRLMMEEVKAKIARDLENSPKVDLSEDAPHLANRAGNIRQLIGQLKERLKADELPKNIVTEAYPPCIGRLYENLLAGQHISHSGRFSMTSFLLTVGMKVEAVVKLYTSVSDFSENMTRYQVEHIAGEKGSRTKYIPPDCDSLRTHNLCPGPDEICQQIRHPLSYYRRKVYTLLGSGRE